MKKTHEKTAWDIAENETIEKTLQHYVIGICEGDTDRMRQAFHKAAQIYGFTDQGLLADSIESLYSYIKEHGPSEKLEYSISLLDLSGDAAVARIEIFNLYGRNFTDFFTLLRINNEWVITNKTYHRH